MNPLMLTYRGDGLNFFAVGYIRWLTPALLLLQMASSCKDPCDYIVISDDEPETSLERVEPDNDYPMLSSDVPGMSVRAVLDPRNYDSSSDDEDLGKRKTEDTTGEGSSSSDEPNPKRACLPESAGVGASGPPVGTSRPTTSGKRLPTGGKTTPRCQEWLQLSAKLHKAKKEVKRIEKKLRAWKNRQLRSEEH